MPEILTACVYAGSMYLHARLNPQLAPIHPEEYKVTRIDRAKAAVTLWSILLLSGAVMGGIYTVEYPDLHRRSAV